MEWRSKMKKGLVSLMAAGALALASTGCTEQKLPIRSEKEIMENSVSIELPFSDITLSDTYYASDLDNDGKVDVIHRGGFAFYVFPGMEDKVKGRFRIIKDTDSMSPEMRAYASDVLTAQRNFIREVLKSQGRYSTNPVN